MFKVKNEMSPKIICDIFTYGPIVQCECETPFEKNTFVDDGVQTITNKL